MPADIRQARRPVQSCVVIAAQPAPRVPALSFAPVLAMLPFAALNSVEPVKNGKHHVRRLSPDFASDQVIGAFRSVPVESSAKKFLAEGVDLAPLPEHRFDTAEVEISPRVFLALKRLFFEFVGTHRHDNSKLPQIGAQDLGAYSLRRPGRVRNRQQERFPRIRP